MKSLGFIPTHFVLRSSDCYAISPQLPFLTVEAAFPHIDIGEVLVILAMLKRQLNDKKGN